VRWIFPTLAVENSSNSVAVTVELAPAQPSTQALLQTLAALLSESRDEEQTARLGKALFPLIETAQQDQPGAKELANETAKAIAEEDQDDELRAVAVDESSLGAASDRTIWRYLIIVAVATAVAAGAAPVAVLAERAGNQILDEIIGDSVKAVIVTAAAIVTDLIFGETPPPPPPPPLPIATPDHPTRPSQGGEGSIPPLPPQGLRPDRNPGDRHP
jgi:hypothetical protein